ncbi:MAG: hypothetical protein D3909_09100 [Candidatus Electrothrix sp. ATG1]|nr:hypothetical protein [Candidatus Electrothrix sp. ATG1]
MKVPGNSFESARMFSLFVVPASRIGTESIKTGPNSLKKMLHFLADYSKKVHFTSLIIFLFYSTFDKLKSCKYKIVNRKEQISRLAQV